MIVTKLRITIKNQLFLEGGKRSKGLVLWRFTAGQQDSNRSLHFLPSKLVQPSAAQWYVCLHYPSHPSRERFYPTPPNFIASSVACCKFCCQHSKAPDQNVSVGARSAELRGGELTGHIQI